MISVYESTSEIFREPFLYGWSEPYSRIGLKNCCRVSRTILSYILIDAFQTPKNPLNSTVHWSERFKKFFPFKFLNYLNHKLLKTTFDTFWHFSKFQLKKVKRKFPRATPHFILCKISIISYQSSYSFFDNRNWNVFSIILTDKKINFSAVYPVVNFVAFRCVFATRYWETILGNLVELVRCVEGSKIKHFNKTYCWLGNFPFCVHSSDSRLHDWGNSHFSGGNFVELFVV